MTQRPDGSPGRGARLLYGTVLLAIIITIGVAILAYRQSPSSVDRGRSTLPAQAAEGSGAAPR